MKKILMTMMVAAAALVGCSKSEDMAVSVADKSHTMIAEASVPAASRTVLVEEEGVYKAYWNAGDQLRIMESVGGDFGGFFEYTTPELAEAAATASFEVELEQRDEFTGEEPATYYAVYPATCEPMSLLDMVLTTTLPSTQEPTLMTSYDGKADLLVAHPVSRTSRAMGENVAFTMERISAVAKLNLKNMQLEEGEFVKMVTFACEQNLAGKVNLNFEGYDGLSPMQWSVAEGEKSITVMLPESQSEDFSLYFSCLPATLKAGESYTVTVRTTNMMWIKTGVLASDLTLSAGDITSVSVNMGDAASKTKVENLSEEFEYVIGYTTADGKTYLLDRTGIDRNPVGAEISSLGLTLSSTGSIVGEVSKQYRWNFARTSDGKLSFYYQTNSGNVFHLTAGDKNQGIAIQKQNEEGKYVSGYYYNNGAVEYFDAFTVEPKEGGYYMNVAADRYLDYVVDLDRFIGNTKEGATGAVNFYRVQPAPQKTLYPVITKAADVTEGTYVIMYNVGGTYYALPNTTCTASPVATPAAEAKITIEEGCVTDAEIGDAHKWILTITNDAEEGLYYQMKSWADPSLWLWHKNNSTGMAVAEVGNEAISGSYTAKWNILDHETSGLEMNGVDNAVSIHTRYAVVSNGAWGTLKVPNGTLVLVKISDSTDPKLNE